jgi:hypothetical protein
MAGAKVKLDEIPRIWSVDLLRDHAFDAELRPRLGHLRAIADDMTAEMDHGRRTAQQGFEIRLAFELRQPSRCSRPNAKYTSSPGVSLWPCKAENDVVPLGSTARRPNRRRSHGIARPTFEILRCFPISGGRCTVVPGTFDEQGT